MYTMMLTECCGHESCQNQADSPSEAGLGLLPRKRARMVTLVLRPKSTMYVGGPNVGNLSR